MVILSYELASGIRRDQWRRLARARRVLSTRRGRLQEILIPITEVARLVVGGCRPKRGRPRELPPDEETVKL